MCLLWWGDCTTRSILKKHQPVGDALKVVNEFADLLKSEGIKP